MWWLNSTLPLSERAGPFILSECRTFLGRTFFVHPLLSKPISGLEGRKGEEERGVTQDGRL